MQDDFSALEASLEKLTPAPVSERTREAIQNLESPVIDFPHSDEMLNTESTRSYPWMRMAAATLVLSAGFAAWIISERSPDGQPSASTLSTTGAVAETTPQSDLPAGMRETPSDLVLLQPPEPDIGFYEPVSFESVIINQRDEGILQFEDTEPLRQIRRHTLNHSEWVNPITGDRFIATEPDEEVMLFNVNTN